MVDYSYANLAQIKSEIKIQADTTPNLANDAKRFECGQFATQRIDEYTGIRFAPYIATIALEQPEVEQDKDGNPVLRLPVPVLSITTLTDNSGNTLVENTDFVLLPRNQTPKTKARFLNISVIEPTTGLTGVASITGVFGWRRSYSAAYTQLGTVGTDSGSSIAVSDSSIFQRGDFLRIGSEFLAVTAINDSPDSITVSRAVNGSTTATHAGATPIYRFNPEPGIVRACQVQTKFMMSRVGETEATKYDGLGTIITYPTDLSGEVENALLQGEWNSYEMWIPFP